MYVYMSMLCVCVCENVHTVWVWWQQAQKDLGGMVHIPCSPYSKYLLTSANLTLSAECFIIVILKQMFIFLTNS